MNFKSLYDYQESFVTGLASKISTGVRKVVGQLATGGGKTVTFAAISHRYIAKSKKRVLILVHRRELLEQTRHTCYDAFGLICQPIIKGMKYIPPADIYVGMVESTHRRISKLPKDIGLVIIDECHRLEFVKLQEHFPTQYIIGFTATPWTASKKKPLKMFYEDIVCGVDIPTLIQRGFLCQNITWAPKDVVDREALTVKGEEFEETAMAAAFSKPRYVHNTITAYEKHAKGTKTLVFNANIFHSREVTKAFQAAGYNARHLGYDNEKERKEILHWFKTTHDAILCNVDITTTGFDEPTVETIIVNKATMSVPLWIQICGRGSRPTLPKSAFTIIDMGGNAVTHGDWCQARDWYSIFYFPPKPGKDGVAPVKVCPKCEAVIAAATKICPHCGYVYPDKEIEIEAVLHEFIVVTKSINVEELIRDNAHKKEYYAFFKLGTDLAIQAKKFVPGMCDDYANFILRIYHHFGKLWVHAKGRNFNRWHQIKSKEHLFNELKNQFPEWKTDLIKPDGSLPLIPLQPLKPITSMWYGND